jgi:hypothetical protein
MPKTFTRKYHSVLAEAKKKLVKLYKRGMKDPAKLCDGKIFEEWYLLRQLVGTAYLNKELTSRWFAIDKQHMLNVARSISCPR